MVGDLVQISAKWGRDLDYKLRVVLGEELRDHRATMLERHLGASTQKER